MLADSALASGLVFSVYTQNKIFKNKLLFESDLRF